MTEMIHCLSFGFAERVKCRRQVLPHDQAKSPGTGNQFSGEQLRWKSNRRFWYGSLTNCYNFDPEEDMSRISGEHQLHVRRYCRCCSTCIYRLIIHRQGYRFMKIYLRGCDKNRQCSLSGNEIIWWNGGIITVTVEWILIILSDWLQGQDVTPPTINHLNIKSTSNTNAALKCRDYWSGTWSTVLNPESISRRYFSKLKRSRQLGLNLIQRAVSVSGNNFHLKSRLRDGRQKFSII